MLGLLAVCCYCWATVGDDLPTASAVEKSAEVSGGGLAMDGETIKIDNTVVPSNGNFNLADVDANGLVVAYKPVESQDLPIASDMLPGAISPGVDLAVDAMGRLNHISKAPAGTYTKITTDDQGHTIQGDTLTADDLPDFPGDKITDNSLDGLAIKDRSITEVKLSDYSTALCRRASRVVTTTLGLLVHSQHFTAAGVWPRFRR